jgi:hypothetical protein
VLTFADALSPRTAGYRGESNREPARNGPRPTVDPPVGQSSRPAHVVRDAHDPSREAFAGARTAFRPSANVRTILKALTRRVSAARVDHEYRRRGTANLFLVCEPLGGRPHVRVTERRTRIDWAHTVRELVDVHYPAAEKIVLAQDNLNTHTPGPLYEAFPPAEAKRLADKLGLHYTPKHGSWLNIAELELGVLARQCLGRRIPDRATLEQEVAAWEAERNAAGGKVNWRFATEDARIKLKRLYPSIGTDNPLAGTPGVIDGEQPGPVRLPAHHVGRRAAEIQRAAIGPGAAEGPAGVQQRQVVGADGGPGLDPVEGRLQSEEAAERLADGRGPAHRLPRLGHEGGIRLIERHQALQVTGVEALGPQPMGLVGFACSHWNTSLRSGAQIPSGGSPPVWANSLQTIFQAPSIRASRR